MPTEGTDISREQLVAYLLGELPAEELAELDQKMLCDSAFATAAEALRTDLLDEYATGEATGERDRLRRALNVAGDFDRPVQLARALHIHLSLAERQFGSRRRPRRRPAAMPIVRWALPLAACLVLGFGAWQYWLGRHRDIGVSAVNGSPAYTLLLRPDRLRGGGVQRVVRLPAGLTALPVQIVVPRGTQSADVILQGPAGSTRIRALAVQSLSGTSFVQLTVPRSALPPGEYRITVHAAGGEAPTVKHYWVAVVSP